MKTARCFAWPTGRNPAPTSVELLFFTGRIDNIGELQDLCDAPESTALYDLLVALYKQYGPPCADLILGDFVVALWDPDKQSVVCFRDVAGCGIAYYSVTPDHFVIAETIQELLTLGKIDADIDLPFAHAALSNLYYHPEHTYLRAVRKVPPAHVVTINRGGRSLERYWNPKDIAVVDYSDRDEAHSRFRKLFRQAVKDRLPEHDKIGVHLSGGMDCSSVAIAATEILQNASRPAPCAFAWQPPPDQIETLSGNAEQTWQAAYPAEYELISSAAIRSGLEPIYCPMTKNDCLEIWDRDETTGRASGGIYGEWPVLKQAKALGVKTILTGVGGDEVASFNGRGYLPGLALRLHWITLYRFARASGRNGFKAIASELRVGLNALLMPSWLQHSLIRETPYGIAKWKSWIRAALGKANSNFLLSRAEKTALNHSISYLNDEAFKGVKPLPAQPDVRKINARRAMRDAFERGQICERIEGWAVDGAKHGVKYEYPLLDKRILEFCFALPEHAFQDPQHQRLFFRQAMAPILPELICKRPKGTEEARSGVGFQAGIDALLDMGARLKRGDIQSPRLKYIDREKLTKALDETLLQKRPGVARRLLAIQFIGPKCQ